MIRIRLYQIQNPAYRLTIFYEMVLLISVLSEVVCTEEYVGHNFLSQDEKTIIKTTSNFFTILSVP